MSTANPIGTGVLTIPNTLNISNSPLTITLTGSTNVTLPTSGTLVASATAVSFSSITETASINMSRAATAVSANATKTITGVTSNAAQRTITLLTADVVAGRIKIIKDEAGTAGTSNNILIATQGGQNIDGLAASNIKITANYGVLRLYSDGSNWWTW